ncbi:FAD-dependent oxidoreductase [Trichothermofontia sp.]
MTALLTHTILSQIPGNPQQGLAQADHLWQSLRQGQWSIPQVVQADPDPLGTLDWDVIISGGTLGIFMGAALAQQGWRVVLLERGVLRGRDQEWNVSRSELRVFLDLGLLSAEELTQAIATTYNPARISFLGGPDYWVQDVLNLGVDPVYLLERLKQRFLAAGGQLLEQTEWVGVTCHPDGVAVSIQPQSGTASSTGAPTSPPPTVAGTVVAGCDGPFFAYRSPSTAGTSPG